MAVCQMPYCVQSVTLPPLLLVMPDTMQPDALQTCKVKQNIWQVSHRELSMMLLHR